MLVFNGKMNGGVEKRKLPLFVDEELPPCF